MKLIFQHILPGDPVFFRSCSLTGAAISIFTCGCFHGPTHVGFAVRHKDFRWPLLCESTSECDEPCVIQGKMVSGVQFHTMRTRVAHYARDKGSVWHYPLAKPLTLRESRLLTEDCLKHIGTAYDWIGALNARHTLIAEATRNLEGEDLTKVFCSEWTADRLRLMKRFSTDNASAWSPRKLSNVLLSDHVCGTPRKYRRAA